MELFPQIMGAFITLALGLFVLGSIGEWLLSLGSSNKSPEEAMRDVESGLDNMINMGQNSDYRDLNVDALGIMGLKSLGDAIDSLKTDFDPLVRLSVCHMFIEQLSSNYSEKDNSSIGEFSFHFFKDQLSDDDWDMNFSDSYLGSGYFELPVFWAASFQHMIQCTYEKCSNDEEKGNMCVHFCAEIASGIDDDELTAKFIEIAQKSLSDKDLMTKSAQSALMSLEL